MSTEERFAKALVEGFRSPGLAKRIGNLNRPSYSIGDGTSVVLGDAVRIPDSCGGRRAGQWGEVLKLSDEGLGLRFNEKVSGITREFFEWDELTGARATAAPRTRKRLFITPPSSIEPRGPRTSGRGELALGG